MPWLDFVWRKNPVLLRLFPAMRMTPIVQFALSEIEARREDQKSKDRRRSKHDILDEFIEARSDSPDIPEWYDPVPSTTLFKAHSQLCRALLTWTLGGLGAGGDTSVTAIRSLFFYLFTHKKSLIRLRQELDLARQATASFPWEKARNLPYLDACIREASRLHPSIGLPLERVVPVGGLFLGGSFIPSGTTVGVNAWVVNRDREVFGADADHWRPERWLCDRTNRMRMDQCMFSVSLGYLYSFRPLLREAILQFGAGHRACPGQSLFALIVSKILIGFVDHLDVS